MCHQDGDPEYVDNDRQFYLKVHQSLHGETCYGATLWIIVPIPVNSFNRVQRKLLSVLKVPSVQVLSLTVSETVGSSQYKLLHSHAFYSQTQHLNFLHINLLLFYWEK